MTVDTMETIQRLLDNQTPLTSGVVNWTDTTVLPFTSFVNASASLLAATNPSGNTVRIASGVGVVQGWLFASDDNVDFDVSTGPTTSTNYIVLRRDRTAQTVRLAYIVAAAPAGTAVLTQNATTWEVIIATVLLDGASALSVLTDSRAYVKTPLYPPQLESFFIPATAGRNETDSTNISPTMEATNGGYVGVVLPDNKLAWAGGSGIVPRDKQTGNPTVQTVFYALGQTGNAYGVTVANRANCGDASWIAVGTTSAVTLTGLGVVCGANVTAAAITTGQLLMCKFDRLGTDGLDTLGADLTILGWKISYIKQYSPDSF